MSIFQFLIHYSSRNKELASANYSRRRAVNYGLLFVQIRVYPRPSVAKTFPILMAQRSQRPRVSEGSVRLKLLFTFASCTSQYGDFTFTSLST